MSDEAHESGASFRPCWGNCGVDSDTEMLAIDAMEETISPLPPAASRIRELISTLEMCHHKAERWVYNIIETTGQGDTSKGLGTRPKGQWHLAESTWQHTCEALSAWCAGCPTVAVELTIDSRPAGELLAHLGQRSPLKEWQVQRVAERIREFVGWSKQNTRRGYVTLLDWGGDCDNGQQSECPEYYQEHSDFWRQTVRMLIKDTEGGCYHSLYGDSPYGENAELSLAVAIDMLWPCNWNFVENLEMVLGAIGGNLKPSRPFAFCSRNIKLSPLRERMRPICHTLQVFSHGMEPDEKVDANVIRLLGEPSNTKKWLTASLDKTIRIQMDL